MRQTIFSPIVDGENGRDGRKMMDGGTRAREIKSISLLGFRLILHWKVQFEFGRKLVFGVKAIGEVNATNSTIGVDLE